MTVEAPRPPVYKNPFVWAFVVGIVFLTALPFLQKVFLKAPPPVGVLPSWHLRSKDGSVFSSTQLLCKVWVLQLVPYDCRGDCLSLLNGFGRMQTPLEDLHGQVLLVTLVLPGPEGAPAVPDSVALSTL